MSTLQHHQQPVPLLAPLLQQPTWEQQHPAVQTPPLTGANEPRSCVIFTRQMWQRTMPGGNVNPEPGVAHSSPSQSQSQDHNDSAVSANLSRRNSSNHSTRPPQQQQRRSPSPSRADSKTPLTPEETPPFIRSTRKRTAGIVEIENKELEDSTTTATTTPVHSRGSSGDSTAHVCICQPDPKIPRPRNGTSP